MFARISKYSNTTAIEVDHKIFVFLMRGEVNSWIVRVFYALGSSKYFGNQLLLVARYLLLMQCNEYNRCNF